VIGMIRVRGEKNLISKNRKEKLGKSKSEAKKIGG